MSQIQSGLLDAGLSETSVQAYLQSTPGLTRTHGRWEVVFLTRTREHAMALDFALDTATVRQPLLKQAVNGFLCRCAGFGSQVAPMLS